MNTHPQYTDAQITQQIYNVNFQKAMLNMDLQRVEERRRDLERAENMLANMKAANRVNDFVI